MKKIFLSVLAVAALASCTKMDTAYETPQEIGFKAVAGNMTKSVVDGTTYPTDLNMFIYAWTASSTAESADYINNGEFVYRKEIDETNVWGGQKPYYWPNVHKLYFAGYSASGNASTNASYNCQSDILTISGYTPGNTGANDLMWFPKTADSYGKNTVFVPVTMYHTCAWITFLVKGDAVTGNTSSPYTITGLKMTGVDQTATVSCSNSSTPQIQWTNNTDKSGTTAEYSVALKNNSITLTEDAKDVETGAAYGAVEGTTSSNIVVIPQVPGKLSLTYTYTSAANKTITETVDNLDLALAKDKSSNVGPTLWEPGKHYIYTITIKANEILIAPTPVDWKDGNWNITVE